MTPHIARRTLVTLVAAATLSVASSAIAAWPDKPITIVVSDQAGGPGDIVARAIGQQLGESLKQSVVVDNRPGAFGTLGLRAVAQAKPDGYTLGIVFMPHTVSQTLFKGTPYQLRTDFTPVAKVADLFNVLVVNKASAARTPQELAAQMKARPGQLSFASGSAGSPAHLSGELFNRVAATQSQHVPFKGPVDALTNLVGGRVDYMFLSLPVAMPMIKGDKIVPLAVTSNRAAPALPQVPTMAQSGFPEFVMLDWMGIVGPAKLPADVLSTLSEEIRKIVLSPTFRERIAAVGMDAAFANGTDLGALIDREITKWERFTQQAGIALQ